MKTARSCYVVIWPGNDVVYGRGRDGCLYNKSAGTLFRVRADAALAINRTMRLSAEKGLSWRSDEYKIIRVEEPCP